MQTSTHFLSFFLILLPYVFVKEEDFSDLCQKNMDSLNYVSLNTSVAVQGNLSNFLTLSADNFYFLCAAVLCCPYVICSLPPNPNNHPFEADMFIKVRKVCHSSC